MNIPQGFRMLACAMPGVEAVEANSAFSFGRHTHEQFGVGLMEYGAQKSASGRGVVEAEAGNLITVNPGEVHDGSPIGRQNRAWRMLYFDPELISGLIRDVCDGAGQQGEFTHPVIKDSRTSTRFQQLYLAMTRQLGTCLYSAEEALLCLLGDIVETRLPIMASVPTRILRVQQQMDDDPTQTLSLLNLAQEACLSQFQFLRGFSRATGLTPHAYLLQRRIHLAKRLIITGMALSDAALACGFADQSHMTRVFVRTFGITPGACAKARH